MAVKLVITNRKGGTGKTTVSVNLAAELAAQGKRVLLIDLDSQNHCAVGLGLASIRNAPTTHDIFRDVNGKLIPAIESTVYPNLSLAQANPLFEHGSGLRDENLLAQAILEEQLDDKFDVIIIDTPPSLDILLLNALNAANLVLVPYVPHPLSFEGVRQLMRVLFKVISGPNPKLKIAGLLPIMGLNRVRQHQAVNNNVSGQYGSFRVMQGIRSDIKLAEAFAAGKPVRYSAPKSRGAEDFVVLANTIGQMIESMSVV
jgi:chromosome partitioning protein